MKKIMKNGLATLTAISVLSPVLSSYNHHFDTPKLSRESFLNTLLNNLSPVKPVFADDDMERITITAPSTYTTPFLFYAWSAGSGTVIDQNFNVLSANTLGGATPYSNEQLIPEGMLDDVGKLLSMIDGLVTDLAQDIDLTPAQRSQLSQISTLLKSAGFVIAGADVLSELYINNNLTGAEKSAMIFALGVVLTALGATALPATAAAGFAALATYAVDKGGLFDYGFDSFEVNANILSDKLDYYYNLDLNQLEDPSGYTLLDAYDRFVCDLTVCTYIPPIIIDLDGDGLQIAKLGQTAVFLDIDGDGYRENVEWPLASEGIIFYDFNEDGRLTSWNEIMLTGIADEAISDLDGLRYLDSNKDGKINHRDDNYDRLGIWQDINQDGSPQSSEYKFLNETDISEISLNPQQSISSTDYSSILSKVNVYTHSNPYQPMHGYDTKLAASESGHKIISSSSGVVKILDEQGKLSLDYSNQPEAISLELNRKEVNDTLYGVRTTRFADSISVDLKQDVKIMTGLGDDIVSSDQPSKGQLHVIAGPGNDSVSSTNSYNKIYTGSGNDHVNIRRGDSRIEMGSGDDTLKLDRGSAIISLGEGRDTVFFTKGKFEIVDFSYNEDTLILESGTRYSIIETEKGFLIKAPGLKVSLSNTPDTYNSYDIKVLHE